MQKIPRSGIALLGVMFITVAGAFSVLAQAPQASESSSISAVSTSAVPTGSKTENAGPAHRSAAPAAAAHKSSSSDDGWQFQVTPYLWLPSSSTTASIGNLTVTDAKEGLASSRKTGGLNFGFEGVFEAHHNKFTILSDFLYADVGTERGTPGPGFSSATTGTKAYILDPEVGYRFNQNPDNGSFVEVLGGIRYWHVAETFNLTAGTLAARSASSATGWTDGIVGLRGRAAISKNWFVTAKGDIGGGGSKLTYQIFGGLGWNFTKRMALVFGYRDLYVNKHGDVLSIRTSLYGPLVGIGFKF